ncbi:pseudouridine synthase [Camillea tinctor]|nr:pseudouridine synthase [Camillea tinctor]
MRLIRSSHYNRPLQRLTASIYRQIAPRRFYAAAHSPRPGNLLATTNMEVAPDYNRWTKEALIQRVHELEAKALTQGSTDATAAPEGSSNSMPQKKKPRRAIDPSKYSTRLIALKLAYLGKNYGGFEYQASTKEPAIEEELWKALVKACLIFPEKPEEVRFEEWEYSKCGRTDRGVSAFGQVIAIRVRSNRPLPKEPTKTPLGDDTMTKNEHLEGAQDDLTTTAESTGETAEEPAEEREFDDFVDELPYPKILNKLLPPDIRILAWCPTTPAGFSARHHCRERQYRYFFTQPAYSPFPTSLTHPARRNDKVRDGWLDLDAMRTAAKKFEGLHDFRNFCKVDPSKGITNFDRRIFEADVVEVPGAASALPHLAGADFGSPFADGQKEVYPRVYYLHVRGSAFLWHQIRCMVAVLFMVGQGLEEPSIVDRLLDVEAEPRRPNYTLASETPLVLWDCIFPALPAGDDGYGDNGGRRMVDAMEWVYQGEENPLHRHGPSGLVDEMWASWRERKMDELLAGQLLGLMASQADITLRRDRRAPLHAPPNQRVFEGANRERAAGKYQPVLQKVRLASPEEVYDKEARKKGYASAAEMREVFAARRRARDEEAAAAEAEKGE